MATVLDVMVVVVEERQLVEGPLLRAEVASDAPVRRDVESRRNRSSVAVRDVACEADHSEEREARSEARLSEAVACEVRLGGREVRSHVVVVMSSDLDQHPSVTVVSASRELASSEENRHHLHDETVNKDFTLEIKSGTVKFSILINQLSAFQGVVRYDKATYYIG